MVPVSFAFEVGGQEFRLVPDAGTGAGSDSGPDSGRGTQQGGAALYWPAEQALLVADLHLEKASHYARHGQLLPPYDSRETLERLAAAVRTTGARRVYTLGDNFHDAGGPARLEPYAAGMLAALTTALDWVWVTGNHDETDCGGQDAERRAVCGGTFVEELAIAGLVLRHQAKAGETRPELSGHFHPKVRLRLRQRHISRPCAVVSRGNGVAERMILPAFGALTGGMDAADPAIVEALQPATRIDAILPAGGKAVCLPLWQEARRST
tara:strand:- start:38 stop:838 length:801 start_codon:yes stop_codon:yes gene_type:complete